MPSSTHKYIIFTSMGCGGAVVVAIVLTILTTQRSGFGRRMLDEPSTLHSAVALDSLDTVRTWYRRPLPDQSGAAFALLSSAGGDGAPTALAIWRDSAAARWVPFGDTFPAESRQRRAWGRNVDWDQVDSLLAAARRPWRPGWTPVARPDGERVRRGAPDPDRRRPPRSRRDPRHRDRGSRVATGAARRDGAGDRLCLGLQRHRADGRGRCAPPRRPRRARQGAAAANAHQRTDRR